MLPIDRGEHEQQIKPGIELAQDVLVFPNADCRWLETLRNDAAFRGFHVIRDPRDIVVSGYFSRLYSHPVFPGNREELLAQRQQLAVAPTIEEGLILEMDYEAGNFAAMSAWDYRSTDVFETTFEHLTADPEASFVEILEFCGTPVPRWGPGATLTMGYDELLTRGLGRARRGHGSLPRIVLRRILSRHAFVRKSGNRRPGEENVHHHYRKGISGDWRNYFAPRLKDEFKERYGALLIQLRYEQTMDW
jgi:hypothetical protein